MLDFRGQICLDFWSFDITVKTDVERCHCGSTSWTVKCSCRIREGRREDRNRDRRGIRRGQERELGEEGNRKSDRERHQKRRGERREEDGGKDSK